MAERRVQMRPGRRERRRDGDGDGELKRRSRSEGPAGRRVAQSMDVGSANNSANRRANHSQGNASFERRDGRGNRADRESSLGSDDGGAINPDPSGSDSDSDSDRMQWTKNPLMVRKLKKNKTEKRNAASDNANTSSGYTQLGQRNTNRESWVYLAPEGTPLPTSPEQLKAESGSNSGSLKNKYQKLEEMRKKRIDIAMTSDEENTPESRISRLRQRALQGALGSPARTDNSRAIVSDHNSWGRSGARTGSAVMSDQGTRQTINPPANHYNKQSVIAQPQAYRSGVAVSAQPANRVSHQPAVPQTSTPRHSGMMVSAQSATAYNKPVLGNTRSPQPVPTPVKQGFVRPFTDTGITEAASPSRQQFYTIPEPHVGSRVVHNSSPEVHVRRFNPAGRIPSADSIYEGANNAQDFESNRSIAANRSALSGRIFAQVNPPSQDVVEVQRGTALQYQPPANQRQPGASKFNEVVELRLKSARVIDRPLSQTFKDPRSPKSPKRRDEGGFHSEDSLDELIESNIQYLEKEMKQGGSKKSLVPVSRSSSLPDPRKSAALANKPQVTVSGQQFARSTAEAPVPIQNNKSELHFRVPLHPQTTAQTTPTIHIAEENQWSEPAHLGGTSYTFGAVPRVERKLSYDSRTQSSRPTSEHYGRDPDVSKSDTQLNAAVVQPTYRGAMLHPNSVAGRGYVSDQNLTVDYNQGMFSDVDYDIEVSERVKKWETFMKKPEPGAGSEGKKPMLLTPIEERTEGDRDSLMMPSEVRKSLRMARVAASQPSQDQHLGMISIKPANSDPALHMGADARVLSKETNLHRFFQVVQDPASGLPSGPHFSQSTSSIYIDLPNQGPQLYSHSSTLYQPGGLMSPDELRQHMLANQRSRLEAERNAAAPQLALTYDDKQSTDPTDRKQRLSRYQDEIDEMKSVKHQSVSNLRRRFDEGKMTASEEESRPDSRVAKVSPTQKDSGDVNWSQMITGLEDRIRDMEVWSPNMESTQGNVVSIERVKARTLQTIPFSEDPFWKEIEEMTTFDPNSLGGHLSASEEVIKPCTAQTAEESPHSSTLPTQPRLHSAMSSKERMQRSKSLYTPNITPLTINVEPYSSGKTSSLERGSGTDKYSGPSALDEVLEDIRTSLERKPLSPKRKVAESSDSHRSSPGPFQTSEILRARSERARAPVGHHTESWDNVPSTSRLNHSHVNQPVSITISSTAKPAPPAAAVPGMTAGHYHLDPHLLKQKLLSTGLVEEDHKPEPPARSHVPGKSMVSSSLALSKPVAVAPPQAVVRSVVAPTQRAAVAAARPPPQEDKLSQVTNSMEDLRQLAVDVERKISIIKSRLLTADDQNLDKILLALRKFSPSAGPHSPDLQPSNMQDFYHTKKNKLEDALSELERIYVSLDLNNDMLLDGAERRDYPSYRTKPVGTTASINPTSGIGSAASPSRLMSSSSYMSPLSVATVQAERSPYDHRQTGVSKVDIDKQAQSEFDVISKSFQAIIDEVNKTASLVSSASTPQPRPKKPLPEIKELQSKLYASKEQDIQKYVASPEPARRPLNVTLISQQVSSPAASTPKSPPAVAPKPSLRMQASAGQSLQYSASPSQQTVSSGVSIVTTAQSPVTSVVRAEMAKPAPEKREQRVRGRFRPKPANQEKEDAASRRARSKSSPTITLQDLQDASASEGSTFTSEGQPTAKTQLNFQLEPAGAPSGSRKPPLHLDIAKAQQGSVVELQIKPPAMFQDGGDTVDQPSGSVVAQSVVLEPSSDAPPPESKTVVFPGTPPTSSVMSVSTPSSSATQPANPSKADVSSSESSAETREKKSKQKMGRGVAMMVEMFSSSDEERLKRSHPLHTRSAPDLSADMPSDDAINVPSSVSNIRPAEMSRLLQYKTETGSAHGSPATERRRVGGGHVAQADGVGSPQSPSNKPPFHPFRRQQPSPDRTSESSPQRNTTATEARPADTTTTSTPTASDTTTTTTTTSTAAITADKVTLRARSVASKSDGDDAPERPRSFHELLSTFEPDLQRLGKLRSQGRCASEEVLPEQVVVARVFHAPSFTSEPDLRAKRSTAPTPQGTVTFQLKVKNRA
ncbi:uncharacterized protein LOC143282870 isoform X5 [Babylonia areolata]